MTEEQLKGMINDKTLDATVDDMLGPSVILKSVGGLIDNSWFQLAKDSEIYQNMEDEMEEAEDTFRNLELSEEQREVVCAYASAVDGRCSVINDFAYAAGYQDCIKLLKYLGLIKTEV